MHGNHFFRADIVAAIDDFPAITKHHAKIKAAAGILSGAQIEACTWRQRPARQHIGAPIGPPGAHGEKGMG